MGIRFKLLVPWDSNLKFGWLDWCVAYSRLEGFSMEGLSHLVISFAIMYDCQQSRESQLDSSVSLKHYSINLPVSNSAGSMPSGSK